MKKNLTLLIGIGFLGMVFMRPQGFAQDYLEEVRACQYLEQGNVDAAITSDQTYADVQLVFMCDAKN